MAVSSCAKPLLPLAEVNEIEHLLTLNELLKTSTKRGIDFWVETYSYDAIVSVVQLLDILDQSGYTLEEVLPALKQRRQSREFQRQYRDSHREELSKKSAEKWKSLPAETKKELNKKATERQRAYRAANKEAYNEKHAEYLRRYRAKQREKAFTPNVTQNENTSPITQTSTGAE